MTRTQLRELPRQDLIELARRTVDLIHEQFTSGPGFILAELADRLEDCGRTDDYPFNSQPIPNQETNDDPARD